MRRLLSIAIVVCAAAGVLFARPELLSVHPEVPQSGARSGSPSGAKQPERKEIHLKADLMGPVESGDSAIFLVGNFAAQHNGAVITCDSAVRYSPDHIEFFGNVLINKNTTYIYGDRANYDGVRNEARVYSDIVKVIDGDATLYTYEFIFNTRTNVGTFGGGGVLLNRDNLVEADHGFYYTDTKELICVDDVEMRNQEYDMKGDSVVYNLETDHAWYFENTNIWNSNNEYLYADCGEYRKTDTLYKVTLNGYILTPKQEVWSDSIDYYRGKEHAILRRNIQIDDTEHKSLAFGDYGEYWKTPGNVLLTRRPSVVNYDPEQPDSLFMRADSMFLFTIMVREQETAEVVKEAVDSLADEKSGGQKPNLPSKQNPSSQLGGKSQSSQSGDTMQATEPADSLSGQGAVAGEAAVVEQTDSIGGQPASEPELTLDERKAKLREAALKEKADRKAEAAKLREAMLDSIADRRQTKITTKLLAEKAHQERALEARKVKAIERLRKQQAKALRKGREMPDSSMLVTYDSLLAGNALAKDLLEGLLTDSLQVDSLLADTSARVSIDSLIKADTVAADTMYRLVKAYRNVRTYRVDFQSVCDSLIGISRDSTLHLYIDPVLWNEENQITSDVMDIFTENQQIVRAEFIGKPMMVGELDTMHYNQVTGNQMEALFRDNKIYRNDVNGNAQTIYYIQEDDDPEVKGMMVIDSGSITFYINQNNKIETITYRNDVTWTTYPMTKIPPEVAPFLKGFKWEGRRRPTRDEVFDRTIRPTEREKRLNIPRPVFPIAERLEQDKKRFGERGWADRSEVVAPDIDEWMRSLGFSTGQPRKSGTRP